MSAAEQVVPEIIRRLESYERHLRWIHVTDSRPLLGQAGFPDFIIAGPHGILFRECKPGRGSRLSPGQSDWRWMLTAAGASWAVWCQQDLDDGTVDNELWQIAGLEAFTHD